MSILINSTRFDAVSMHLSALNSTFLLLTLTVHGPIKLIASSSQGVVRISLSGNNPQPLPDSLCLWQCSHLNLQWCIRALGGGNVTERFHANVSCLGVPLPDGTICQFPPTSVGVTQCAIVWQDCHLDKHNIQCHQRLHLMTCKCIDLDTSLVEPEVSSCCCCLHM